MQELRFVAVSEDGSYAVLAIPGRSGRFMLPLDDRLRAVAKGQFSRLAQYEIEVENPLRPKEIQARIRAGETVQEIADAAGIPVDRVRWFEGPVLAERGYLAEQAQNASVRRQGDSTPGPRLGDIVGERLIELGADPEDAQWDSRKLGDGSWQVQLAFRAGGRLHIAEWLFDPRRRHVAPADDNAARLSLPDTELPPPASGSLTAATVTPIRRPDRPAFPPQRSGPGTPAGPAPDALPEAPTEPAEESVPEPVRVAAQVASRGAPVPSAPIPPRAPATRPPASEPAASAPPRPAPAPPAAARTASDETPAEHRPGRHAAAQATPAEPARAPERPAAQTMPAAPASPAAEAPAASQPQNQPLGQPAAAEQRPAEPPARGRSKKSSQRGRRASVPSWDEIMLGNSRQPD
jgi:hypothetical protein